MSNVNDISPVVPLTVLQRRVIICLALTQFAIATAHVATCLQMAIDGLVRSSNPDAYYGDQAVPVHVAQIALFYVNVSAIFHGISQRLTYDNF